MENWGAVTTREESVFYNNHMSLLEKRRALNIAHEFAHIWFGNLLTTSSWNQFWLNEGFARFMDLKAVDIYSEYDQTEESRFSTLQSALWIDDEPSINPLVWEMRKPSDAYDILNNINYDKGGSVLKLVEDLIGNDNMQMVLQTYIRKYQYRNVDSQDFVNTLQEFVNFNATDFLNGFIKQSGYPLISVSQIHGRKVSLHKTRFLRMDQAYRDGRFA
ncbi:hypothetical protein ILUMI_17616 [Ignelater luminosus]|uniref:Peptidase M1 membrane alanine aminopeptidase domain-containing protein n=1 Tax=Ignelater luminosus TaxID=2038154 RepID=A0A8K0G7C7_IGNLU|nr:hypothetical protein ILUMI_17616 [Ignelater luminosus]